MDNALIRFQNMMQVERLLLLHHETGLRVSELADALGLGKRRIRLCLAKLGAIPIGQMRYRLAPTPEETAHAQALLCAANDQEKNVTPHATAIARLAKNTTPEAKLAHVRWMLLLSGKNGVSVGIVSHELGVGYSSAWRYLKGLHAEPARRARFRLSPTPGDIELAHLVLRAADAISQSPELLRPAPDPPQPGRAYRDRQRLQQLKLLLLRSPDGLSLDDLQGALGTPEIGIVRRYLNRLRAVSLESDRWVLIPPREDVELAQAVLGLESEAGSQPSTEDPQTIRARTRPVDRSKTARAKQENLARAKRLLLHNHKGVSVAELTDLLGVSRRTTLRYLRELGAESLRAESDEQARHRLIPTAEDIELAQAVIQAAHGFGVLQTKVSQDNGENHEQRRQRSSHFGRSQGKNRRHTGGTGSRAKRYG